MSCMLAVLMVGSEEKLLILQARQQQKTATWGQLNKINPNGYIKITTECNHTECFQKITM